jgi:hypothetical protein
VLLRNTAVPLLTAAAHGDTSNTTWSSDATAASADVELAKKVCNNCLLLLNEVRLLCLDSQAL